MITFLSQARNHMGMAGFSVSKNGRFFILEKSIDDNLHPYELHSEKESVHVCFGT